MWLLHSLARLIVGPPVLAFVLLAITGVAIVLTASVTWWIITGEPSDATRRT